MITIWFERARLQTIRMLQELPTGVNLELTHAGGLEAMIGLEWFQGYARHEAFHHRQIDQLATQLPRKVST